MKKRVVRRKVTKKSAKSPLAEAIKDIESEVKKLSKERARLKSDVRNVSFSIETDREMESKLQKRLAALIEREGKLNKKKKSLQSKIDTVSDKVNKISKIRSEMGDV